MTEADLLGLWRERDRRYSMAKYDLSDQTISDIRTFRRLEVNIFGLPILLREAITWSPPPRIARW